MTEQDLLELRDQIEEAKTTVSELKGVEKQQMKTLLDDWECKTTDDAEKKVETLEAEIQNLNKKIQESLQELEKKYIKEE